VPEILDYPFMRTALLAGAILGVLFALMGVFVVSKGMSFFSDFIGHAAILGGALALLLGLDTTLFLIPYSLALGFLVSSVWQTFPLSRDAVLGVFYGGAVAIGMILVSVGGIGNQSLMQFLFGDILLVRGEEVALAAGLLAAFALFLAVERRRLLKAVFLPEIAAAEGIAVKKYDYVLMSLLAVTIAVSIKLVGAVLANAMVVIPAASARIVSRSFRQFLVIAPIVGVFTFTAGTAASFYGNIPSGPAVIATAFGVFVAALAANAIIRGAGRK
jgi:ABC-type Mn2+/Zn2+ transport system permease subunit